MKKSLEMVLHFILILITALIVGMLVYIQYVAAENLVAGSSVDFPKKLFLYGFFKNAPTVLLLMIPLMLIYKVRHLANPVLTTLTYFFLCLTVWLAILPLTQIGEQAFFGGEKISVSKENALTGGYFRKVNDKYFYFIQDEDSESETAQVLEIFDGWNPDRFGNQTDISVGRTSSFANAARPFKDTLIKQNLQSVSHRILKMISLYNRSVVRSWENGYISWLCFCSLGFLMASAYSLIAVSTWRMVNVTYIIIVQAGAIVANTVYFFDSFFSTRLFLNKLFYGADFSRFQYFQNRLIQLPLVAINLACGLLVIIVGSILTAARRRKWA